MSVQEIDGKLIGEGNYIRNAFYTSNIKVKTENIVSAFEEIEKENKKFLSLNENVISKIRSDGSDIVKKDGEILDVNSRNVCYSLKYGKFRLINQNGINTTRVKLLYENQVLYVSFNEKNGNYLLLLDSKGHLYIYRINEYKIDLLLCLNFPSYKNKSSHTSVSSFSKSKIDIKKDTLLCDIPKKASWLPKSDKFFITGHNSCLYIWNISLLTNSMIRNKWKDEIDVNYKLVSTCAVTLSYEEVFRKYNYLIEKKNGKNDATEEDIYESNVLNTYCFSLNGKYLYALINNHYSVVWDVELMGQLVVCTLVGFSSLAEEIRNIQKLFCIDSGTVGENRGEHAGEHICSGGRTVNDTQSSREKFDVIISSVHILNSYFLPNENSGIPNTYYLLVFHSGCCISVFPFKNREDEEDKYKERIDILCNTSIENIYFDKNMVNIENVQLFVDPSEFFVFFNLSYKTVCKQKGDDVKKSLIFVFETFNKKRLDFNIHPKFLVIPNKRILPLCSVRLFQIDDCLKFAKVLNVSVSSSSLNIINLFMFSIIYNSSKKCVSVHSFSTPIPLLMGDVCTTKEGNDEVPLQSISNENQSTEQLSTGELHKIDTSTTPSISTYTREEGAYNSTKNANSNFCKGTGQEFLTVNLLPTQDNTCRIDKSDVKSSITHYEQFINAIRKKDSVKSAPQGVEVHKGIFSNMHTMQNGVLPKSKGVSNNLDIFPPEKEERSSFKVINDREENHINEHDNTGDRSKVYNSSREIFNIDNPLTGSEIEKGVGIQTELLNGETYHLEKCKQNVVMVGNEKSEGIVITPSGKCIREGDKDKICSNDVATAHVDNLEESSLLPQVIKEKGAKDIVRKSSCLDYIETNQKLQLLKDSHREMEKRHSLLDEELSNRNKENYLLRDFSLNEGNTHSNMKTLSTTPLQSGRNNGGGVYKGESSGVELEEMVKVEKIGGGNSSYDKSPFKETKEVVDLIFSEASEGKRVSQEEVKDHIEHNSNIDIIMSTHEDALKRFVECEEEEEEEEEEKDECSATDDKGRGEDGGEAVNKDVAGEYSRGVNVLEETGNPHNNSKMDVGEEGKGNKGIHAPYKKENNLNSFLHKLGFFKSNLSPSTGTVTTTPAEAVGETSIATVSLSNPHLSGEGNPLEGSGKEGVQETKKSEPNKDKSLFPKGEDDVKWKGSKDDTLEENYKGEHRKVVGRKVSARKIHEVKEASGEEHVVGMGNVSNDNVVDVENKCIMEDASDEVMRKLCDDICRRVSARMSKVICEEVSSAKLLNLSIARDSRIVEENETVGEERICVLGSCQKEINEMKEEITNLKIQNINLNEKITSMSNNIFKIHETVKNCANRKNGKENLYDDKLEKIQSEVGSFKKQLSSMANKYAEHLANVSDDLKVNISKIVRNNNDVLRKMTVQELRQVCVTGSGSGSRNGNTDSNSSTNHGACSREMAELLSSAHQAALKKIMPSVISSEIQIQFAKSVVPGMREAYNTGFQSIRDSFNSLLLENRKWLSSELCAIEKAIHEKSEQNNEDFLPSINSKLDQLQKELKMFTYNMNRQILYLHDDLGKLRKIPMQLRDQEGVDSHVDVREAEVGGIAGETGVARVAGEVENYCAEDAEAEDVDADEVYHHGKSNPSRSKHHTGNTSIIEYKRNLEYPGKESNDSSEIIIRGRINHLLSEHEYNQAFTLALSIDIEKNTNALWILQLCRRFRSNFTLDDSLPISQPALLGISKILCESLIRSFNITLEEAEFRTKWIYECIRQLDVNHSDLVKTNAFMFIKNMLNNVLTFSYHVESQIVKLNENVNKFSKNGDFKGKVLLNPCTASNENMNKSLDVHEVGMLDSKSSHLTSAQNYLYSKNVLLLLQERLLQIRNLLKRYSPA
ncbi:conserved Plasmodium protein, unknown function [Plasmodium ovale curtisi]|uniref:WD repeat-containing protein n=1 Tax=Plasmodium ovale curtisi TaxID=864141 RepID=A0A1A8WR95_PLAOA|nr:conserved Plasmodium protein, unknown function [Plasmodium ovale curtisi]SBS95435.1 conserved Plasmodium protein, unknown function [Plasmodium ovale curtisi]